MYIEALLSSKKEKRWQQLFGAHFDSIFDICDVWVNIGVFWNDSASHGAWVIEDGRCHGHKLANAKVLPQITSGN